MTGRRQLLIYPEGQEIAMGLQAYGDVVDKTPASTNAQYSALVAQVGHRIAAAAGRNDFEWEFRTLQSDEQNAFCLPGGKVAVYEGIMPVCQNEAGLAVVMGHEIAHALARHGGERMSHNAAVQRLQQVAAMVTQTQDQVKKEMLMKAYGMATQYGVLLPYSRKHESEADEIGITLMAQAGYDPSEAPLFWKRFGAAGAGEKPPEFLSTHPSDERRSSDLQALLPKAQNVYQQAAQKHGKGSIIS